jgi:DNA-binding HxlR family transcriptional regulator
MKLIDFNGLNSAVHGPVRLGIMTLLHINGPLDFTTLKKRIEVADGVLGAHLRKLEETGYIACRKRFIGKRPNSRYCLLPAGRAAFDEYLQSLRTVLDAVEVSKTEKRASS